MLKRQIRFLNGIYDFLGLLFMAGLILCCWLQVAARFINSVTIVWTDELAGYMMVGCCFFGAGTAMRHGGHLGAYVCDRRLKGAGAGRGEYGHVYAVAEPEMAVYPPDYWQCLHVFLYASGCGDCCPDHPDRERGRI